VKDNHWVYVDLNPAYDYSSGSVSHYGKINDFLYVNYKTHLTRYGKNDFETCRIKFDLENGLINYKIKSVSIEKYESISNLE
jgi:hypothetical protein